MALLIDGYNLLHATDIFAAAGPGTELHRARMALLEFLAAAIIERERRQTTIVFDAAGAPPGLPRTFARDGITVHFARRHSDADEMIEELLEQCPAPRAMIVVSSDHRLQRAARHFGARFIDSDKWYADLRAARQAGERLADEPLDKLEAASGSDVEYWLEEFADSEPGDSLPSPFPPGYADDVPDE